MVPIIQTSIVGIKHVNVLSSHDAMNATRLGVQVTPQIVRKLLNKSIMDSIISYTITGKLSDKQPFLWSTHGLGVTSVDANMNNSQFVAQYPVGTNTGVLRNLVLRFNISVDCLLVPQSDFLSTCPGIYPLNQTYSNINSSDSSASFGDPQNPRYRIRICAPGDTKSSPWEDTADQQDITEEFWLDYQRTMGSIISIDRGRNYTQHCYGNSTLGYFELPHYWNGNVAGPLLDKVPPNGPNLTYQNLLLSGQSTAGSSADRGNVTGPFLTAVLAVFGPSTFFTTAAANRNVPSTHNSNVLCRQLRYPFTGIGGYTSLIPDFSCGKNKYVTYPVFNFLDALMNWLPTLGDHDHANAVLTSATYAAPNAILNVGPPPDDPDSYFVYTSAGTSLQKPDITLAGMVVVSLLFAAQIIGLALLAVYASRRGTWTGALNSWAMLKLGAEIGKENLPSTVSDFDANVNAVEAKREATVDPEEGSSMEESEGEEDGRRARNRR